MVRKSGKGGVRSGNTLRASNSRYNRNYQSESCIVRQSSNLSRRQIDQLDEADDATLHSDGVVYSLNKKGRWALPKMIKDNLKITDTDITVSMYQKHKVKRAANCVEFSSNKGQRKSFVPSHGYFNESSINVKQREGRRRRGRREENADDNEAQTETPPPDPKVRYDVFYPSPATSSLAHNPKYIRNAPVVVYEDGQVREVGVSKKGGGRRRVNNISYDSPSDAEEVDSYDEELSDDEQLLVEDFMELQTPEVMLVDILEAAERAKQLCSVTKKRKVKGKKTRQNNAVDQDWILVQPRDFEEDEAYSTSGEEETAVTFSSSVQLSRNPHLVPVRVILQRETVHPEQLQERFPNLYKEAQCRPRRFIIDTTQAVADARKKMKHADSVFLGSLDFSSCLVFTRDAPYDDGLDVYRVLFNISCSENSIRVDSLFDLMSTTVFDVLQAAVNFSATLPISSFHRKDLPMISTFKERQLITKFLPSLKKYSQCDVKEGNSITKLTKSGRATKATGYETEAEIPEYCDICFSEINPEFIESETATCLNTCNHWFCDGCWREHITETIVSGRMQVRCPEYNCDHSIGDATLLSIVNIRLVDILQQQRFNLDIDISPNKKWCPNARCGRVLEKEEAEDDTVTVSCPCGTVVCFSCLKDSHWPALCDQVTDYKHKLKKYGDDNVTVNEEESCLVRGKTCPKCNRHIEKNGGCKYMECICGHAFCWTCRGDWNKHQVFYQCNSKSDTYGTLKTVLRRQTKTSDEKGKSNMYKLAVSHRERRKPGHVQGLKSAVNSLSSKLRTLHAKGVNIEANRINSDASTEDVHDFLMEMLQLKLELNHVIEHSAVLLDGRLIRTKSNKFLRIIERLDSVCVSLEADFVIKERSLMNRVIPNLCYLRSLAQRGVTALSTCVAQAHTVEKSSDASL